MVGAVCGTGHLPCLRDWRKQRDLHHRRRALFALADGGFRGPAEAVHDGGSQQL